MNSNFFNKKFFAGLLIPIVIALCLAPFPCVSEETPPDGFLKHLESGLSESDAMIFSNFSERAIQESVDLFVNLSKPFTSGFWEAVFSGSNKRGWLFVLWFFLGVILSVGLAELVRKDLRRLSEQTSRTELPWRNFAYKLFRRSLWLLFLLLFLVGYERLHPPWPSHAFLELGKGLLLAWLFSRWILDFTDALMMQESSAAPFFPLLRMAVRTGRTLAFLIFLLAWSSGPGGVLATLARDVTSLVFLGFGAVFWKRYSVVAKDLEGRVHKIIQGLRTAVAAGGVVIFLLPLILDIAGHLRLAQYWMAGWARMSGWFLWGIVLYHVLRERGLEIRKRLEKEAAESGETGHPVPWLSLRMGWVLWFFMLLGGAMVAWNADERALYTIFRVVEHQVTVGSFSFSFVTLGAAVLILSATSMVARVFTHLFHERVLADSGLEVGFKDSVTTLSVYVIWALGILVSLSALGVSGTSMAVAFGAVGIGLGFGLQNIFSNFVSGLILLFERPIQVGDILEIGSTWGTVRKINVRSTIVQTFDNASLIVPNSEIISNQVTNWSFKDPRLRRNLTVGVAYGSNVLLVRKTLLEVAESHHRIYKKPRPEVLFMDFADSALIFRLRFWTHVDTFFTVESEVRYEIDRLFRERGIRIPFPQRDLHLVSLPEDEKAPPGETAVKPEGEIK